MSYFSKEKEEKINCEDIDFIVSDLRKAMTCIAGTIQQMLARKRRLLLYRKRRMVD